MKNNSSTQERSPKSIESELPKSPQQKSPLFANHPWLLVVGVGALSMAIALVAVFSLTNTGRVAKDPTKQTTILVAPQQPTPTKTKNNSSPNWILIIFLLGASVASVGAIYKWRPSLLSSPKRGLTRRQQRRLSRQKGNRPPTATAAVATEIPLETSILENQPVPQPGDDTPFITVLPPEKANPNDFGGQSLAEMMDIRQHLSLAAILQDLERPD
ncbi:MAG: hypothetical protein KME01_07335 [Chroococcus sp. CMT-3BRIN-NPC107]|nr:hypothetical protein [Chroococcus sp. CMT-3BRIN-NPC107]